MLGNLGFSEILIIVIVALVIFGPNKLPEMGRSVGQAIREFKKATQSITNEVTKVATEEVRGGIDKAKSQPQQKAAEAPAPAPEVAAEPENK